MELSIGQEVEDISQKLSNLEAVQMEKAPKQN